MHSINLCEVYYDFIRGSNKSTATEAIEIIKELGVTINEAFDESFWKKAGELKASQKRIALADTFAITLANRLRGTVITADHKEFDPIAKQKLCKVLFIR
jgi:PIN domain nuclease of toxin-antitoxin system